MAQELRIEHVTIVSPERTRPMRDAAVSIRDGRIVSVSRSSRLASLRTSGLPVEVIDGKGLYLTPGLIDSHVHLGVVPGMRSEDEAAHPEIARAARMQIPRSYLMYGYTTLVDLISTPQRMSAWNANSVHPDTQFCGGAYVIDGYGMEQTPVGQQFQQFPYMLVQPGEESRVPPGIDPAAHTPEAVVMRMKADGASCVKAFAENSWGSAVHFPMIRLDIAQRLVRAAHAADMLVFMHANSTLMQAFALEAGTDIIAHGMWNWDAPPTVPTAALKPGALTPAVTKVLDEIVQRKVGWQPTTQVLYGLRDLFDPNYLANAALARALPASLIEWYRTPDGQWFRDTIAANVRPSDGASAEATWAATRSGYAPLLRNGASAASYLNTRNANILFGTDTPSSPTYANPPGLNGFLEMHRLVETGMTPARVFRAATLANAQALRLSHDIGTVQVGKRANLLLMREDPAQSVDAYASIVKVIIGGRMLDAANLAANRMVTIH